MLIYKEQHKKAHESQDEKAQDGYTKLNFLIYFTDAFCKIITLSIITSMAIKKQFPISLLYTNTSTAMLSCYVSTKN